MTEVLDVIANGSVGVIQRDLSVPPALIVEGRTTTGTPDKNDNHANPDSADTSIGLGQNQTLVPF
jgi:hypothetical protein